LEPNQKNGVDITPVRRLLGQRQLLQLMLCSNASWSIMLMKQYTLKSRVGEEQPQCLHFLLFFALLNVFQEKFLYCLNGSLQIIVPFRF
jgi:hypothetical protein